MIVLCLTSPPIFNGLTGDNCACVMKPLATRISKMLQREQRILATGKGLYKVSYIYVCMGVELASPVIHI